MDIVQANSPRKSHVGFGTVNRFRKRRGLLLSQQIDRIANAKGGPIRILDVGGRIEYWRNLSTENVANIVVLNNDSTEISVENNSLFEAQVGDARDMPQYKDNSFDLAHSNSVIEHVGPWQDMRAMASEMMRVASSGWVQTPAWEFPIEPHFRAPFLHWFGQPMRRKMLAFSSAYRGKSLEEKRWHVDRINLLSKNEILALFPECDLYV